jgi:3-oxoacid CoA-transferase subunit B
MFLVHEAKLTIILMEHAGKDDSARIVEDCSLPMQGRAVAQRTITDRGVVDVTVGALRLFECAPGVTLRESPGLTAAPMALQ